MLCDQSLIHPARNFTVLVLRPVHFHLLDNQSLLSVGDHGLLLRLASVVIYFNHITTEGEQYATRLHSSAISALEGYLQLCRACNYGGPRRLLATAIS
jgi:hypothetical protein